MDKKKNSIQFKNGSYSVILSLIAVAIVVVINLFANALPETVTNISTSDKNYYNLTDVSIDYLNNTLDTDINLYLLSDSKGGYEDYIEKLCSNYAHESSHINYKKIDTAVNPTFVNKYNAMTASEYSVIVENPENGNYRLIDYSDIRFRNIKNDEYNSKYIEYSYDGEGLITSALAAVRTDRKIKMYQLGGHGETFTTQASLPELYNAFTKSNYEISGEVVNLSAVAEVPMDCELLMIYFPRTDFSSSDVEALKKYAADGGRFIIIANNMASFAGKSFVKMDNFYSFLNYLGVGLEDGYIRENSTDRYLSINSSVSADSQAFLLPFVNSLSVITSAIKGTNVVPYASPIKVLDNAENSVTITELLKTSADYTVYYFEDGKDPYEVPYNTSCAVADYIETTFAGGKTSKTLLVSSVTFIRSGESSSGTIYDNTILDNNIRLVINAANSMDESISQVYVAPKIMKESYNSVSSRNKTVYSIIFMGLIPAFILMLGFAVWFVRRSK